MRVTSVVAVLLSGMLAAPVAAQLKPPKPALSSIDLVEGRSLEQWTRDLTDKDPSVREKAIRVIPSYGAAASGLVSRIVYRCGDKDFGPRSAAILALGIMEIDERDVPLVVSRLASILGDPQEQQHGARLAAAVSLMRFGEDGKPAIRSLIGGVNDAGSWQIRKASIIALRRIGTDHKKGPDPLATKAMLRALNDEAFQVKKEAIQALGFMDKPVSPILRAQVYSSLKAQTLSPEPILAMWAHVSLMALDKVTEEEMKFVTKNVTSQELEVRGQAVLAIGTLGVKAKSCVPLLIDLLQDKDSGIIVTACWALVSVGEKDPKALNAMKELIDRKDLDKRVREQAAMALDELKNSKKTEMQEKLLKDGDKHEKHKR